MRTRFVIVMGVAGSGKTTVGRALAEALGWHFYDADDHHSPANVAKMTGGTPLGDADRAPWLTALAELVSSSVEQGRPGVLACSALKGDYRTRLRGAHRGVMFVYLRGSYDVIRARMAGRTGHYMEPGMLRSQFDDLEEPGESEGALVVDASRSLDEIVGEIRRVIEDSY